MSRKILEDTVLNYFNDAPLPYAEMMFRLASGALKRRRLEDQGQARTRKARKQRENEESDSSKRPVNGPQPV